MQALEAATHAPVLQFEPRVPRARRDAVVNSLEYAGANRQINFLACIPPLHVHGERAHVAWHSGGSAHAAMYIHNTRCVVEAVGRGVTPAEVAQVKNRLLSTGCLF